LGTVSGRDVWHIRNEVSEVIADCIETVVSDDERWERLGAPAGDVCQWVTI